MRLALADASGPARRVGSLALVASLLLAGCAGSPPKPTAFAASGSGPLVFAGYDYNGTTVQQGTGTFRLQVDPATDTGNFTAGFTTRNHTWQVTFQRFAAASPDEEGGVRAGFPARGASRNGDSLLPEFPALVAGWGPGALTRDGAAFTDAGTDSARFRLAFALSDRAVRDPTSHRVTKSDGTTPYDPATPRDAHVVPGARQLLLDVRADGLAKPLARDAFNDTVQGPSYNRTWPFEVEDTTTRLVVNLTVRPAPGAPLAPGLVTFVLTDPAGQVRGRYEYAPTPDNSSGGSAHFEPAPPLPGGNWSLQVFGSFASLAYDGEALREFPEPLFLHIVYLDARIDRSG